MHEMPRTRRHAHEVEQFHRQGLGAFDGPCPAKQQRQADVFQHVHGRQEVEKLEHDPQVAAAVESVRFFLVGIVQRRDRRRIFRPASGGVQTRRAGA